MEPPPTDYGYWISPEGAVHAVDPRRKHVGFAAEMLGKPPGGEGPHNDDHRVELMERGWTRVATHSRRFVAQLPPTPVSAEVLAVVDHLLRRFHRAGRLPITVHDHRSGACAGGRTVRPGDPRVLRAWGRMRRTRQAEP